MRKYKSLKEERIEKIFCNQCGKEIKMQKGMPLEGTCRLKISWDYFSNKDAETHLIDLCEECYDKWVGTFAIPVTVEEENELL